MSMVMKDEECFEHTAYGCKDQLGEVNPIWYNNTVQIAYKNTDLPRTLLDLARNYHMNIAKSVFVMPTADARKIKSWDNMMNINMSYVVRPFESKVCVMATSLENEYHCFFSSEAKITIIASSM